MAEIIRQCGGDYAEAAVALLAAGFGDVARARAETIELTRWVYEKPEPYKAAVADVLEILKHHKRTANALDAIRALAQPKGPGDV